MVSSIQVIVGCMVALIGLYQVSTGSFPACIAVVGGGLLILDGIDRLCRSEK